MQDGTVPLSGELLHAARRLDQLLNQPDPGFSATSDELSIKNCGETVGLLAKAVPHDRLAQSILEELEVGGVFSLALHLLGVLMRDVDGGHYAERVREMLEDPDNANGGLREVGAHINGGWHTALIRNETYQLLEQCAHQRRTSIQSIANEAWQRYGISGDAIYYHLNQLGMMR